MVITSAGLMSFFSFLSLAQPRVARVPSCRRPCPLFSFHQKTKHFMTERGFDPRTLRWRRYLSPPRNEGRDGCGGRSPTIFQLIYTAMRRTHDVDNGMCDIGAVCAPGVSSTT